MVTIRDVATDAGVAPSTVSYVLTGKKQLPPDTVAKVMASVGRLGFRPSSTARALALGRTNVLGFLATVSPTSPPVEVDIFMRFVRAAMYTARQRSYDVLIMGRGDDELEGDILADALVVMDIRFDDPRLPFLRARGLPTVLIGMPGERHGLSAVDLDFEAAGGLVAQHLTGLGHRELAVLGPTGDGSSSVPIAFEEFFRRGIQAGAQAAGAQVAMGRPSMPDMAGVQQWLETVRRSVPDLSAVVVLGVSALDALFALFDDLGVDVPRDCSVVVVAPEEEFGLRYPRLTLVDMPGRVMVERAVNLVLDEVEGAPGDVEELLPPELLERGSTAPSPPVVPWER